MYNLRVALPEVYAAERDLLKIYAIALKLFQQGGLTSDIRAQIYQIRDEVYETELEIHSIVSSALRVLSPVLSVAEIELLAEPTRFPNIPVSPQTEGLEGTPAAAVGAGPWVLGIVVILSVAAVAAYAVHISGEALEAIIALRERTQRFRYQLAATLERFTRCRKDGHSFEECNSMVPIPEPPQDPTARNPWEKALVWGTSLGVLSIVGAGSYFFWKHTKSSSGASRMKLLPEATSGAIGGYDMRVVKRL